MVTIRIKNDFCRIIVEHASGFVGQVVSESILGGVVYPLLYPHLRLSGLDDLSAIVLVLGRSWHMPISDTSYFIVPSSYHGSSRWSHSLGRCKVILAVFILASWFELVDISLGRRTGESRGRQQTRNGSSIVNPAMRHDLVDGRSFGWVIVKNSFDKILGRLCDVHGFWESIVVHSDSFVGCLNVIGLKRWLTNDQGVDDDSKRPNIYLIRMSLLSFKHLRSNIIRCTANSPFPLSIKLKFGG